MIQLNLEPYCIKDEESEVTHKYFGSQHNLFTQISVFQMQLSRLHIACITDYILSSLVNTPSFPPQTHS